MKATHKTKIISAALALTLTLTAASSAVAFAASDTRGGPPTDRVNQQQTYQVVDVQNLIDMPLEDLNEAETAALVGMVEEEKVARDTYLALYDIWGAQIFSNIASSEQQHMDVVSALLTKYGIPSPVLEQGVFTDPAMQALYDDMVAAGSVSLEAAYQVGVTIEQVDIADLEEDLLVVDNADIIEAFERLIAGSENHLAAFTGANVPTPNLNNGTAPTAPSRAGQGGPRR